MKIADSVLYAIAVIAATVAGGPVDVVNIETTAVSSPHEVNTKAFCFAACSHYYEFCVEKPFNYNCDARGNLIHDKEWPKCREKCWCMCDAACPRHRCD